MISEDLVFPRLTYRKALDHLVTAGSLNIYQTKYIKIHLWDGTFSETTLRIPQGKFLQHLFEYLVVLVKWAVHSVGTFKYTDAAYQHSPFAVKSKSMMKASIS